MKKTNSKLTAEIVKSIPAAKTTKKKFNKKKVTTQVESICNSTAFQNEIKELVKDQSWDDILAIDTSISDGIVTLAATIKDVLNIKDILLYVDGAKLLNIKIQGFMSDLQIFSGEILKLRSKFKNYEGAIKDENELFEAINIYQEYQTLSNKLLAVLSPIHSDILVTLNLALVRKEKAHNAKSK